MLKYIFSFLFILNVSFSFAQEEDRQRKLEEQKARILEEIRQKEQLLGEQKKKEKMYLKLLHSKTRKLDYKLN